ncbi:uncharacterized [Tachysurus ichikawai]
MAEHMTKNIPTTILFSEDGSRPLRFSIGSTTLSFRGISIRINTASTIVNQAAGNVNTPMWPNPEALHRIRRYIEIRRSVERKNTDHKSINTTRPERRSSRGSAD